MVGDTLEIPKTFQHPLPSESTSSTKTGCSANEPSIYTISQGSQQETAEYETELAVQVVQLL